jgi:folylpolyglutamate synthase/dihydropteroate synthase
MARPDLDPGLSRVARALARLGHPERAFAAVHVAGTNGKGSVCALVESALRASGALAVGRFTSPFLREPRDAVWLRGAPPAPAIWDAALAQVLAADREGAEGGAGAEGAEGAPLTTFELWTAASFLLFREARIDVAVVEVGVGGRLDATNVLPTPAVAVVTSISLDHVELLGPTLSDIAAHKAGIIKGAADAADAADGADGANGANGTNGADGAGGAAPRPVAVMAPGQEAVAAAVVRARAAAVGADLVEAAALEWLDSASDVDSTAAARPVAASPLAAAADALGRHFRVACERPPAADQAATPPAAARCCPPLRLRMALQGRFQLANGGAALAALRALQADPRRRFAALTDEAICKGFEAAAWPGRLEAVLLRVGDGGGGDASAPATVQALLDGGHNEGALPFVREAVDELLAARGAGSGSGTRGGATFVYACSSSRPLATVLPLLVRAGDRLLAVPFTPPEGMAWVRPHAPQAVAAAAQALFGEGRVDARAFGSLGDALAAVGAGELCVVCGSLYLVSDVHRSGRVVASNGGAAPFAAAST